MNVRVLLFALAKQQIGHGAVTLELAENATIGELRNALIAKYSTAAFVLSKSMFAQNDKYSPDSEPVDASAEIACIPPVSGG